MSGKASAKASAQFFAKFNSQGQQLSHKKSAPSPTTEYPYRQASSPEKSGQHSDDNRLPQRGGTANCLNHPGRKENSFTRKIKENREAFRNYQQ